MISTRWRLSAMMFLQYAIYGAWAPVLWPYMTDVERGLGMSDPQAALIFSLLPLACILAPFTGGQIADRWVSTEKFLAAAHLIGGIFLIWASQLTVFEPLLVVFAVYTLAFAPTLALTNSLAFHHLSDEKDFGIIRVFGTIGWIVAGLALTVWRQHNLLPNATDCLMMAGILSIVMAAFCLTLPHTPPAKDEAADPLAFREAFVLLKNPNFLLFIVIAFIVTTELQFYYGPTGTFLEQLLEIPNAKIPMTMAVAQAGEVIAMAFLLRWVLKRWGVRRALALGVIAWPLRYFVFAAAPFGTVEIMRPLVVASLALHGLGYTFFFVVSQIYVDMVAPKDIRASAQSLLTLATLGIGNYLGTLFTGWIMNLFKPAEHPEKWTHVFLVPCVLTVLCALAFLLFFKDPEQEAETARA